MSVDIEVPRLAESISEAVLAEWLKDDGAGVKADEPIATLETDKAAVEIAASDSGVLHHAKQAGDTVTVGDVIARIDVKAAGAAGKAKGVKKAASAAGASTQGATSATAPPAPQGAQAAESAGIHLSPAVRRLVEEHRLDPAAIEGTGKGGRLLKEDVLRHVERTNDSEAATTDVAPPSSAPPATPAPAPPRPAPAPARDASAMPGERIVPMGQIRRRIAERLVHAQQTAAILTTFNEVDMTEVLALRARYKESFEKRHGVRLGFMSFFTRACTLAIEEIPELNAEVRGTDIVYKEWVHMGIAVSSPRGLVVPVVRDADRLGFPEIEREIARLAARAREGTLTIDELSGGTFTITNGGVFGSLLSTPILNPPQSGILGMHKIEKRPIAVDDQVVIRPMMYVAMSYDHRLVDGEQAVRFLVRVKERLEDPERMMLDV